MTGTTIDDLLADARLPSRSSGTFDAGDGLRRLAATANRNRPGRDLDRARQAGHVLTFVSRWVLNSPGAPDRVDRLAGERPLEIEGAVVFACLLYLTGHPESAQFWWQLAAGAGNCTAAHCLHLHHLERGELREAHHWSDQAARFADDTDTLGDPPIRDYYALLSAASRYLSKHSSPSGVSPESLKPEVARLVEPEADEDTGGLICRPDSRLAARLHDCLERG